METIVNAIVLRAVDYKENDKILTLFSLEKGIIAAGAKGVKKASAKLRFCAEPFCFAEYVLAEKNGRFTVIQASEHESFYNIRLDIKKYYAAACVLEFVLGFLPESVESPKLFMNTVNAFKKLSFSAAESIIILEKYILDSLPLCGYALNMNGCGICGKEISDRVFLDAAEGFCVCAECRKQSDVEFNIKTYKLLNNLNTSDEEDVENITAEKVIENKALKLLLYFITVCSGVKITAAETLLSAEI